MNIKKCPIGHFLLHFDVFIPSKCIHSERPLASTLFHGVLLLSNDMLSYDIFPKIRYVDPRAMSRILANNAAQDKHKHFLPLNDSWALA
jgi:hypothetical protein